MTRTVADAALMMGVLSLPDDRDTMSLPAAAIAWGDLALDVKGLRLGLLRDIGAGTKADPEVLAAIEAAAALLKSAGAIVEPVAPFVAPAMIDGLDRFWRARAWADIGALGEAAQARILPYIFEWAAGGRDLSGAAVFAGMSEMMALRNAAVTACRGFDFVLSPVAPMAAFPAELASPTHDPAHPFEHIAFTVPFNMSEQPAAAINAGYTSGGLPIGLQIVGRRFDDLGVLRLSRAYEAMRPAQRPWPLPAA